MPTSRIEESDFQTKACTSVLCLWKVGDDGTSSLIIDSLVPENEQSLQVPGPGPVPVPLPQLPKSEQIELQKEELRKYIFLYDLDTPQFRGRYRISATTSRTRTCVSGVSGSRKKPWTGDGTCIWIIWICVASIGTSWLMLLVQFAHSPQYSSSATLNQSSRRFLSSASTSLSSWKSLQPPYSLLSSSSSYISTWEKADIEKRPDYNLFGWTDSLLKSTDSEPGSSIDRNDQNDANDPEDARFNGSTKGLRKGVMELERRQRQEKKQTLTLTRHVSRPSNLLKTKSKEQRKTKKETHREELQKSKRWFWPFDFTKVSLWFEGIGASTAPSRETAVVSYKRRRADANDMVLVREEVQAEPERETDTSGLDPNKSSLNGRPSDFSLLENIANNQTQLTNSSTPVPIPAPLPVTPKLYPGVNAHASEVLQCRESVINFVINATDGKDECDGLIRAFDQTCRSDEDEGSKTGSQNINEQHIQQRQLYRKLQLQQENTMPVLEGRPIFNECVQNQRFESKRLLDVINSRLLFLKLHAIIYTSTMAVKQLFDLIFRDSDPTNFSEDILENEWDFVRYLAANNLTDIVLGNIRSEMNHDRCILFERDNSAQQLYGFPFDEDFFNHIKAQQQLYSTTHHRSLQEAFTETQSNDESLQTIEKTILTGTSSMNDLDILVDGMKRRNAPNKVTSNETNKLTQIRIPTKSLHLTEKSAADTLLLQQGDKMILAAANQTSATVADHEDATRSKQSITDVTNAISVIFNDPTSIEARTCCASILNVYHELCSQDDEEDMSDSRLFFCVMIMACCGVVKSLIRHYKVLWLPEAAGCILVGVASGYILNFFPHHDVSFDGNWFLRILVPPIIFEAALSIDKRSFNRHIIPIILYSVAGTIVATILTALIVHYGTTSLSPLCTGIPFVEALTFGALISSIDPIAVLSVLSNMGMTDTDTIYVLIFGESLLNDGVAIVLFHTLVHFLDEKLIIDQEAITEATIHFFVVAVGSLLVGVAAGMLSTFFFWMFYGCQTPMVEVIVFFCWALLPYYVCDGIGWSGIVSIVAVGFFMDVYVVGQRLNKSQLCTKALADDPNLGDDTEHSFISQAVNGEHRKRDPARRRIFNPIGHLSNEARTHIGFVTEIISTSMETAIFAYLGLFLFSHRYHWNFFHIFIAIFSCCLSRAIMVPSLGVVSNWITRLHQNRHKVTEACIGAEERMLRMSRGRSDVAVGVIIDRKMQIALWFAGLRGAMSFALVEHIPLYDSFSGRGTRLKPELKAMTSASIMFTVFILGGYTYYMMERLGIAPQSSKLRNVALLHEVTSLLPPGRLDDDDTDGQDGQDFFSSSVYDKDSIGVSAHNSTSRAKDVATAVRRQRHTTVPSA